MAWASGLIALTLFALSLPLEAASASDALVAGAITVGPRHSCALRPSGHVACWGSNEHGRLGDGTTTDRPTPIPVRGLTDAKAIAAGYSFTCAIRVSGQVVCWGWNEYGQLGDGANSDRHAPTPVSGLDDATAITAGGGHACAIRASGQAVCWGRNQYGQLGDGSFEDSNVPTPVTGVDDAIRISAGLTHTCAIRQSGTASCWGDNDHGRLGDGTPDASHPAPVDVLGLTHVAAIVAGQFHTCAVEESGGASCWGWNTNGQLGIGSYADHPLPYPVHDMSDAKEISAQGEYVCAIREDGEAACWGHNELGTQTEPAPVPGLPSVESIAVGEQHVCAILATGETACWGTNDYGQLGIGAGTEGSSSPVEPAAPDFALDVSRTGKGHGTVTSAPAGIDCGAVCGGKFEIGQAVTLTAAPDRGSTFDGWSGACSGSGACTVTMSEAKAVVASFGAEDSGKPGGSDDSGSDSGSHRAKAAFAPLKVAPRVKRLRRGRKAVIRVRIRNRGRAAAAGVKVCVRAPKKLIRVRRCVKLGRIAAGRTKKAKFKIAVRRTAKRGRTAKLRFTATGRTVRKVAAKAKVKIR